MVNNQNKQSRQPEKKITSRICHARLPSESAVCGENIRESHIDSASLQFFDSAYLKFIMLNSKLYKIVFHCWIVYF